MRSWQMQDMVGPPWSVQVELTEGCSRLCAFCGLNAIRGAPGSYLHMDRDTMALVGSGLAQLCPSTRVELAMHGEPTMHPQYLRMIALLRSHLPKSQMMLTTNGVRFTKGRMVSELAKIFNAGINFVMLDTYVDMRDDLIEQTVAVSKAGTRVVDYYEGLRHGIAFYGKNKLHRVLVLVDDIGERDGEHSSRVVLNHAGSNPTKKPLSSPLKKTCTQPFRELTICWNGEVRICCNDWKGEQVMGNVHERSLFSIWHGERFDAVRAMLSMKDRSMSPCRVCDRGAGPRVGLLPKYSPPTAEQRRLLGLE